MLTKRDGTLQAEPAYKTPLQKQIAMCKGGIKLSLKEIENARRTPEDEIANADFIEQMELHVAAERDRLAKLIDEKVRWAKFREHERAARQYRAQALDAAE